MPSSSPHPVLHHLQRSLQKRKVTGPILLGVSGGPDSVCLLRAMAQLVDKNSLHIGHYNHRLRADASDADADYVQSLCRQHALHFHLGQSDQLSSQQTGIENRARQLRYDWLTKVAQQHDCKWVMTGHTMNDQAETVLHHLIRGTGWRGLRGIAPLRYLPGTDGEIKLIRPLLTCSRQDILEYLAKQSLAARHDTSNDDVRFTRNRIRHQIMPQLNEMNPDAVRHLAKWASHARRHYSVVQRTVQVALPALIMHQTKDQVAIHRGVMARTTTGETLQELLRLLWQRQRWPLDQMNHKRWREVIEVCRGTRTAVELPGRIMVRRKELVIQFIKQ
ncbi:MAG: tRNA lysidine(34) synthetase TilS [Gemmatales bacterium]